MIDYMLLKRWPGQKTVWGEQEWKRKSRECKGQQGDSKVECVIVRSEDVGGKNTAAAIIKHRMIENVPEF